MSHDDTKPTTRRPAQLLSLTDAAEAVGVSPRTIRRRIADGSLRAYRVGRVIRINPDDLAELLEPMPSAADHLADLRPVEPAPAALVGGGAR